MNAPSEPPRRYRWPWIVAAAVVLGIVLAVIWMRAAVKQIEQERDPNAPVPNTTSAH